MIHVVDFMFGDAQEITLGPIEVPIRGGSGNFELCTITKLELLDDDYVRVTLDFATARLPR